METNSRTYDAFLEKFRRGDGTDPFSADTPPNEHELAEWRMWATTVFVPNIQAMRDVIVTKSDLLIEPEMPPVLLQLCAHVSGYEITVARWAAGDYDEHLSIICFPGSQLREYTGSRFARLKREQTKLIGKQRLLARR